MTKNKTTSAKDTLEFYLKKVQKIPILNSEDEKETIIKAKAGDKDALSLIILSNQRLVIKEAIRYGFKNNIMDLIGEGNKGLIYAFKHFDIKKNNRFYSYAIWWVKSFMRRYLSQNNALITVPQLTYFQYLKFKKIRHELTNKLKRKPDNEEIAKEMGINIDKVKLMQAIPEEIYSLDKKLGRDNDTKTIRIKDLLEDKNNHGPRDTMLQEMTNQLISKETQALNERERDVIKLRYGLGQDEEGKTLRETGKSLNISPEGVRKIEKRALKKLKDTLIKQGVIGVLN